MKHPLGRRFWVECSLAIAGGLLFVLTLITQEWIEVIFGVDPDKGSGALEWAIVAVVLVITLVFAVRARAERKRVLSLAHLLSSRTQPTTVRPGVAE